MANGISWYNLGGIIRGYMDGGQIKGMQHYQQGGNVSPSGATYNPNAAVQTGIPQPRFIEGGYAAPAIESYFSGGRQPVYAGDANIGAGVVGAQQPQPVQPQPVATPAPIPPPAPVTETGGGTPAYQPNLPPAPVVETTTPHTPPPAGPTYTTPGIAGGETITPTETYVDSAGEEQTWTNIVDDPTGLGGTQEVGGSQGLINQAAPGTEEAVIQDSFLSDLLGTSGQDIHQVQADNLANIAEVTGQPHLDPNYDPTGGAQDSDIIEPSFVADLFGNTGKTRGEVENENLQTMLDHGRIDEGQFNALTGQGSSLRDPNEVIQAGPLANALGNTGKTIGQVQLETPGAQIKADGNQKVAGRDVVAHQVTAPGVTVPMVKSKTSNALVAAPGYESNLYNYHQSGESKSGERKDLADQTAIADTTAALQAPQPASAPAPVNPLKLSRNEQQAFIQEKYGLNVGKGDALDFLRNEGFNVGGPVSEEEKARQLIARSRVQQAPLAQAQKGALPAGQMGGGQSPLRQIGGALAKKALGSALGPFGAVLGGMFNEGGAVHPQARDDYQMHASSGHLLNQGGKVPMQGYNTGGWLSSLFGKGKPRTSRTFGESKKKPRTKTTAQQRGYNVGGMVPNMQMMGPLNPHGYNEGGQAMATPIKKVMDEQKLDQQATAFELDEKRKQEKHALDMKLKQQQFQQAQAMKRASATTNKAPKAPLAKK